MIDHGYKLPIIHFLQKHKSIADINQQKQDRSFTYSPRIDILIRKMMQVIKPTPYKLRLFMIIHQKSMFIRIELFSNFDILH
jgi:hypothetical protein